MTARKMLAMLYTHIDLFPGLINPLGVVGLATLQFANYGDAKMENFLDDWMQSFNDSGESIKIECAASLLGAQLIGSKELAIEMKAWEKSPLAQKTHQSLLDMMREHIYNRDERESMLKSSQPAFGMLNTLATQHRAMISATGNDTQPTSPKSDKEKKKVARKEKAARRKRKRLRKSLRQQLQMLPIWRQKMEAKEGVKERAKVGITPQDLVPERALQIQRESYFHVARGSIRSGFIMLRTSITEESRVDILRILTSVISNTLTPVPLASNPRLCLWHGAPQRPAGAMLGRGLRTRPEQRQLARFESKPRRADVIPGEGDRPPRRKLNQLHLQNEVGLNHSVLGLPPDPTVVSERTHSDIFSVLRRCRVPWCCDSAPSRWHTS